MDFIVIFLILVLGSALIAWIIQGCPAPRKVDHYHYHRYKVSTDYERLWYLIVNQDLHVVIDFGQKYLRYGEAYRGEMYTHDTIYGIGDPYHIEDGKDGFIHYCAWKKLKFFDMADEVTE